MLRAGRQAAAEAQAQGRPLFRPDGSLTPEGVKAVREKQDERAARTFSERQGERDLAVLAAAGVNPQREAPLEEFRRATGRTVPRALNLDPSAAGAHFASLNSLARLNEQAGLTPEQREG